MSMVTCTCDHVCFRHISGSRRYEDDLDEDDHIGILDMGPMGPVVQVIQEDDNPDVNTDNTVNFELVRLSLLE